MKDSDPKMIKITIETSLEIIRAEGMDNLKVSVDTHLYNNG